ncbi:hypothetical protein E2C01_045486 [Portunus trituberculatus]|uniref:Uncharacterized protein n=1 Tax=Portunus trituberculatus TaxID=210409 RepID=A0A5B7G2E4_PORTR|nr:hypothetical protein [Portunus trituberculatus]
MEGRQHGTHLKQIALHTERKGAGMRPPTGGSLAPSCCATASLDRCAPLAAERIQNSVAHAVGE